MENILENIMYKITTMAATVALSMAMVTVSVPTLAADSSEPIVIPTHNWSSQIVMALRYWRYV